MSGLGSYNTGLSAEEAVAEHYRRKGARVLARRWRPVHGAGEIDLIVELAGVVVFVEVKAGRSIDAAACRVSAAQRARLEAAAGVFLADAPGGLDTECRFDVALLDGQGRIGIVENAFV